MGTLARIRVSWFAYIFRRPISIAGRIVGKGSVSQQSFSSVWGVGFNNKRIRERKKKNK